MQSTNQGHRALLTAKFFYLIAEQLDRFLQVFDYISIAYRKNKLGFRNVR